MPDDGPLRLVRKRMFTVTILFSAAVVTAFALAGYSFYQQHQAVAHNRQVFCQTQHNLADALVKILVLARKNTESNPDLTPVQRARAERFYQQALLLAQPLNCKQRLK